MSITVNDKNLGHATAYGYAKANGYTGTESEYGELMASYGTVAQTAVDAKDDAVAAAGEASGSASSASDSAAAALRDAGLANGSAEAAAGSAEAASGSASSASTNALKAEGFAVGEQNGEAVGDSSPYYHNNAAYYADQAGSSASGASGSATSANADALKAEGFAVGEQNGTAVASGSPYYQNNAEYYAGQAAASAAASAAMTGLASAFSSSKSYKAGEWVIQGGKLYEFTADHAAGAWTGTDAVERPLSDEVVDLKNHFDEISSDYPDGTEVLTGTVKPGYTINNVAGTIRSTTSTTTELFAYAVENGVTYYLTSDGYSTGQTAGDEQIPGVVFVLSDELYDKMPCEEIVYVGTAGNTRVDEEYTPDTNGYLIVLHYTNGARGSMTISKDILKKTAIDTVARSDIQNAEDRVEYIYENDSGLNLLNRKSPNVYNGYPQKSTNKYVNSANSRTVWVECEPNTMYCVQKISGARFSVAYGSEMPKNNAVISECITDNNAEFIVVKTDSTAKYLGAFIWLSGTDTVTFDEMIASVLIKRVDSIAISNAVLGDEIITDFSGMTAVGGSTYGDNKWTLPENGGISTTMAVEGGSTYLIALTVDSVIISDFSTNLTVNPLTLTLGDASISIFANEDANWNVCLTPATTDSTATFTMQCEDKLSIILSGLSIKKVEQYAEYLLDLNGQKISAYKTNFAYGNGQRKLVNGQSNIAIGFNSQQEVNTGYANTAIGYQAQKNITNGRANTAIGNNAQRDISTGMYNNAIGTVCQGYITSGCWNNAIGNEAQRDLTSGHNNTAMGRRAQSYLTTGCMNVAIGSFAGFSRIRAGGTQGDHATTTASYQTLVGGETIQGSTEPQDYATAFGYRSMANEKATALGPKAEATGENSIAIGFEASATNDDEIVIGTSDHQTVKIAGKVITFNPDGTVTWTADT